MCDFVEVLEKIKSSSIASVANEEFSEFNKYMHVVTNMDEELQNTINKALSFDKALLLVCGNSGDGKSHLIASMISQGIIKKDEFEVYIDATSSDRKGMHANEKLKEKLYSFSDENINDGKKQRIIVAINLGVLNDFLKNNGTEYSQLATFITANSLFDNVPSWKTKSLEKTLEKGVIDNCLITYVDFTEYHRFSLNKNGAGREFIEELLAKIVFDVDENDIYKSFNKNCCNCTSRSNCPVYYNYKFLMDKENRKYVSELLTRVIIKNNLSPSVREINDFFYECIVGPSFDEKCNMISSPERLIHFLHNNILWNTYEGRTGLSAITSTEDILKTHACDDELIRLNLLPSFEKWIEGEAEKAGELFKQISADIKYCIENHATQYRKKEAEIKKDVYKLYIRFGNMGFVANKEDYNEFVKYLFSYNIGNLDDCEELIELIMNCFYCWNGRLVGKDSQPINNAIIVSQGSESFCLYKNVELVFRQDDTMEEISDDAEYWKFTPNIKMGFSKKGDSNVCFIDIDYDLFAFMKKIKRGYQPTVADRRARVKFDAFVRTMLSDKNDEVHVYSYKDVGKRYVMKKNALGKYAFEEE